MKKLLTIPVMLIYLVAVSGIMINIHYCGQQMESWTVYGESEGCAEDACSDEPEEEDGCCKDEVIAAKVSQDQNVSSFFKLKLSDNWLPAILPQSFELSEPVQMVSVTAESYMPNAPPGRWQQMPLYKLHSSFTYYG